MIVGGVIFEVMCVMCFKWNYSVGGCCWVCVV